MGTVVRAEKTLTAEASGGDMTALAVIASGLAAMLWSSGWQVVWLLVLLAVAGLRRFGGGLADSMRPPGVSPGSGSSGSGPHGPGGG